MTFKTTRKLDGFTLIELIIVLAVLAILVSWAFPSLTQSIQNNRMTAQNNELVSMLGYARSEAIRRNEDVKLTFSYSGSTWGAIIEDPSHTEVVSGCAVGQLRCASNEKAVFNPSAGISDDEIIFNNRGYIRDEDEPWTSATIFLQHDNCRGQNQRRRIDIMPTGQITSCRLPCDSTAACS